MTKPGRFVTRMVVFLVLAVIVVALLHEVVLRAFFHNPALNGLILGVLVFGIGFCFRRVWSLWPEIRWIEAYRTSAPGYSMQSPPRLLAPIASYLGEQERRRRSALSAVSTRYLLDSVSNRLDETRDVSRYMIGLLVFLGLLGTFWGLLQTINAVGAVINGLSIGSGDMVTMFDDLKSGLSAPLSGMGTAFSSSLFGLSGSLILGFLDLQANRAQNSFYNDMEEWLSGLTRLSGSSLGPVDGDGSVPAYIQALLEQTADNLERLQQIMMRSEENRAAAQHATAAVSERLAELGDHMSNQNHLLSTMVRQQQDLAPTLQRLAQADNQSGAIDDATRSHIRNLDVHLSRLAQELIGGREQMVNELRSEIKMVSRTIAHVAGDPGAAR